MTKNQSDNELINALKSRFEQKEKALHELKKMTAELRQVNKKLAESEGLKSHFLSHITNEIVNPFASILGLSGSIIQMKEPDWKKVKNMVALIHSEAFELDFQLKNIFAAAKIEAGEYKPEISKVDVAEIIEREMEVYKYKAEQKELSIEFINEISVKQKKTLTFPTDPEKIKLVISNLLNNGIKFSNAASKIIIKANLKNGELLLSVKDFGIGINKTELKNIFDRFYRIDNSINSLNRGQGLGLSVIKAMLDILEGEIHVKSRKSQGTEFMITIPKPGMEASIADFATDGNELFFESEEGEIM